MADKIDIKRGDIVYADLRPVVGSEQGGIRPVLIVQNNVGNHFSPTTIAVLLTSRNKKALPTHVILHKEQCDGLIEDSMIMCEQIRTIDKKRIREKVGCINEEYLDEVMRALKVSVGMF